jgi:hypothetical protein
VRRHLPKEVREVRRRARELRALVVVVDGDSKGPEARFAEMHETLAEAGLERLHERERIALCVPTRTVETWCLWLLGDHGVDEIGDYKAKFTAQWERQRSLPKRAAEAWLRQPDLALEEARVPSLCDGRRALQRLRDSMT